MIVIINKRNPELTKHVSISDYSLRQIVQILAIYTASRDFIVEADTLDILIKGMK